MFILSLGDFPNYKGEHNAAAYGTKYSDARLAAVPPRLFLHFVFQGHSIFLEVLRQGIDVLTCLQQLFRLCQVLIHLVYRASGNSLYLVCFGQCGIQVLRLYPRLEVVIDLVKC